jgi:hypothetical protein
MAIDGWTSPSSPASLLKGFSLPVAEQEFTARKFVRLAVRFFKKE